MRALYGQSVINCQRATLGVVQGTSTITCTDALFVGSLGGKLTASVGSTTHLGLVSPIDVTLSAGANITLTSACATGFSVSQVLIVPYPQAWL